jgi:subtilisin family serine protease
MAAKREKSDTESARRLVVASEKRLSVLLRRLSLALAAVLAALVPLGASVATAATPSFAGRFIVTLDEGVSSQSVASEYRRNGAEVDFVYTTALNGFAGSMSDANLRALRADHRVARLERDGIATASDTQTGATWGLDRIDQRARPTDGSYTYANTASSVTAFIIDTGIRTTHQDLAGRATNSFDAFGGTGNDCNGHGTHVAGTVGGTKWGVAKGVRLVGVRVLDCKGSGSWSGIIAGLDHVAKSTARPAVANMSLGGGASSSVDDAVNKTIAAGVTVVVAAGNGNRAGVAQDACGYSPARVPAAITVGATTSSDAKTSWSNYGSCVDLFAPGASITSAWHTNDGATNTISGTSMASPHVAGVAALYLQQGAAAPAVVASAITGAATDGVVTSSNTSNNDLLYSLLTTSAPAQTGTVSGTVTDGATGQPVAGAGVAASGTSTATDGSGHYSLTLPEGSHTVSVTASGFQAPSQTVAVSAGITTVVDFVLQAASTETPTIDLTLVVGPKKKNVTPVTASWIETPTPEGSPTYDVWANGSLRETVSGTTSTINWRGSGTVTYHVCRTGTTVCSADVVATIP